MKDWKFFEIVFDNIFLRVLSAFIIHNMFIDWKIKRFAAVSKVAKTSDI